jgi:hypothetical protein
LARAPLPKTTQTKQGTVIPRSGPLSFHESISSVRST